MLVTRVICIEKDNGFVVRTLLAMRADVEELDSNGRIPLVHATMKHREAICKLLLEKGANVEALEAFTSGYGSQDEIRGAWSGPKVG